MIQGRRQLLVPIPPEHQKQVGARKGRVLYWHSGHPGELVLSPSARRTRGKPVDPLRGAVVARLEAEVHRLTTRLERQRTALWNEWTAQYRLRSITATLKGYPALDAINDRLRGIERDLASLAGTGYVAAGQRVRRPRRRRAVPETPSIPPPSPEVGSDGVAGTQGAEPLGAPIDSSARTDLDSAPHAGEVGAVAGVAVS